MQLGLGELTAQAQDLVALDDLASARDLLSPALSAADPSPARATPELAEAAGLYARVLVALGHPQDARPWAAYAYAALTRLYGSDDDRTVTAGSALAAILHRVGSLSRAAHLYRLVIDELTAAEGPESQRVLHAHADLATVEHARGDCAGALNRLEEAWELHREVYGDAHPGGIKMLAKLGAMERDCGLPDLAADHLTLAQDLCRLHLSPDNPLVGQVAALVADAGAGLRADPAVPPPRTPYEAAGDFDEPAHHEDWPPAIATPMTDDFPFSAAQQQVEAEAPPEPEPMAAAAAGPVEDEPPGSGERRERMWVRRIIRQRRPVTERPAMYVSRRSGQPLLPLVIATLVVVLLGTIAVVAGVALVGGSGPGTENRTTPPATSRPPATSGPQSTKAPAPPAFSPGAPPTGLALTDTRDAVTLNWTYPAGAQGPVVLSVSRRGREPRAFQQLPPGTNSYVVYGLDRDIDFCFSAAVVYDADTQGRTTPVCTHRGGS
ncbi:MAG TPA: tetratricopeptide repeat protein [Micromonosporaceae bacterium]